MTHREPDLEQLLLAEDDPAILDFRCAQTGQLLWPHIRAPFLRSMLSDLFYGSPIPDAGGRRLSSRAVVTLSKSMLSNARLRMAGRCHAEICVMATAVGISERDGKWFNRLSDHFALLLPAQTVIVEDQFRWAWPHPRSVDRIMFHAPLQVRNVLIGRALVRSTHERQAERLIGLVSQRARRYVGWEIGSDRQRQLVAALAQKTAALPHQYRGYQSMLSRIAPKVLLKEEACYGHSATLMAAARDMNIVTAEYQHGAVSAGHDAYNLAPALRGSDEYCRTLPQYFLGYGSWWNEQITVPIEKLAMGNPHRDESIARRKAVAGDKRDVLVLGDGIETSLYMDFARDVARGAAAAGLTVVFRPHPLERSRLRDDYPSGIEGARIDGNVDIYDSLQRAHVVVSEVSTGLFEAVGLADRIIVWDTPKARFGYPRHPFHRVAGAAELAQQLGDESIGRFADQGVEAIWARGWRDSYLQFLHQCGIGPTKARVSA